MTETIIRTCSAEIISRATGVKECADCGEDIQDGLIVVKERYPLVHHYHKKCYDALQSLFAEAEEFEGDY